MSIGERIAELRKVQNISQGQLASALDISRQAVSKWENDQSVPDALNMIRLADVLDGTSSICLPEGETSAEDLLW